jgi:FecR protein
MNSAERRFKHLISLVLDGICSDAERDELVEQLQQHPDWFNEIVDEVVVNSLLQWLGDDVAEELAVFPLAVANDIVGRAPAVEPPRGVRHLLSWALVAAIVLSCGIVGWRTLRHGAVNHNPRAIADVVEDEPVDWTKDSTALSSDGQIVPGRLRMNSGAMTLKFRSGTTLSAKGPVAMQIDSDMLVHVGKGQVTTRVADGIKGFTIKTPEVNVIDQGTEFGVAARMDNKSDVIVFRGAVDLQASGDLSSSPKRLIAGEAARIDRRGSMDRIMQVGRDVKGGWWTTEHPSADESVIKEVRDNILSKDGSKYYSYQITIHGLCEDARAYADQPHEWNGVTSAGLPVFLRGADYVKTFNDYRYLQDFEMVVDLSRPATLYIFADDRVPAPKWLKDQFENTGVKIGLDEGYWWEVPDHVIGVGAGNSIDNLFTVWRQRYDAPTSVTLGDVGEWGTEGAQGRAMYGIAATPLDK